MALIVNGVCRFSLEGTMYDRPWANVLDYRIDTTGSLENRPDAIYRQAGRIINSWADNMPTTVIDDLSLDRVRWVDLDSESGSVGVRMSTSEHTLPVSGTATGDGSPGNLSALVTKETVAQRGERNGRIYVPGIGEGATDGNFLTSQGLSARQTAWSTFLLETTGGGVPLDYEAFMVVVHTTGTDPKFGTSTDVEQLVVAQRLATQRRRLRG